MPGLIHLLARAASWPLEVRDARSPVGALVVLGSPTRADGRLGSVGEERVREAVDHWRRGIAPLVVFTGAGAPGSPVEAPAMAQAARELGLPEEAIRVEARSRNTRENARFTAALLRAEGVSSVWIVSQPFHLRRARWLFRRAGLDAFARSYRGGVQDQRPRDALRWIGREYAALAAELMRRPAG